jgi:hypothetical protein
MVAAMHDNVLYHSLNQSANCKRFAVTFPNNDYSAKGMPLRNAPNGIPSTPGGIIVARQYGQFCQVYDCPTLAPILELF